MKTIHLLIVDKKMNTTEIEINSLQFQSLGIDLSKVTKHNGKRELHKTINNYIEKDESQ